MNETALTDALAAQAETTTMRLAALMPDVADIDRIGADRCLRDAVLPLGRAGGRSRVATARPDRFVAVRPMLEEKLGPVAMAVMTPSDITTGICDSAAAISSVRPKRAAPHRRARAP